ncbi:MAG: TetR/AcrR family transcriptional regulator, partial [Myxococcota bacterium]|nr:TetR/AcrR family transcriptional regulator [Myxococcota bacterium]
MSREDEKRRGPGRPKEPQKRERLIGIARQVFAETGYAGTSLTRIALAAGLSKPALFHHFKNKDGLYEAVLMSTVGRLAEVIRTSNLSDGDFVTRLCALGGRLADYFGEHPDAAQLLLREFVNGGPFTSGPGRQQVQLTLQVAVAFVDSGMKAGVFPVADPRRVVLAAAGHLLFYYGARQVTDDVLSG